MIPKIKICGLTSIEDAQMLNQNRVEYAGIVLFYPKSKRNQEIPQAKCILSALDMQIKKVAVTVSPTLLQVREIEAAGFDILQVHGTLTEEVLEETSIEILRAFNGTEEKIAYSNSKEDKIIGYVFDGKIPGNGEVFDWSLIKSFDRREKLLMLAGGLNCQNVQEGIAYIAPDIVDVSSGVEKDSGSGKDRIKVSIFTHEVRKER